MQADVLDIIFEHKNKAFGAYTLRKYYNKRLLLSLGINIVFMAFLSIMLLTQKPEKNLKAAIEDLYPTKLIPIPAEPVAPAPPGTPNKKAQLNAERPMKQTSGLRSEGPPVVSNATPMHVNFSSQTGPGILPSDSGSLDNPPAGLPMAEGNGNAIVDVPEVLEVLPSYPGGLAALKKFLEKNLVSPAEMEPGEEVVVKVRFIVGYDGKLKSFDFVEEGGEVFNTEVIRVLKRMPDWIPGKSNGRNVSAYHIMPVKFVAPD